MIARVHRDGLLVSPDDGSVIGTLDELAQGRCRRDLLLVVNDLAERRWCAARDGIPAPVRRARA